MSGGGVWTDQNRELSGAYVNFIPVGRSVGDGNGGAVAIALPLSWGAAGITEVTAEDFLTGRAVESIGLHPADTTAALLRLVFANAMVAQVYRLDTGGAKATATAGGLTATARFAGVLGNSLIVAVEEVSSGAYNVRTFFRQTQVDAQRVTDYDQLTDNCWLTFAGAGAPTETAAGLPLTGGTDGTTDEATGYPLFFEALRAAPYHYLAVPSATEAIAEAAVEFVRDQRDSRGTYVQAVVADYGADDDAVINVTTGAVVDGVTHDAAAFTAWVAGLLASLSDNESATGREVAGATAIAGELADEALANALKAGQFVLTRSRRGAIRVESELNSAVTDKTFANNQFRRILDGIGTEVEDLWDARFKGKVQRNAVGLETFRGAVVEMLNRRGAEGILEGVNGETDAQVGPGVQADGVYCRIGARPVGAMQKLYTDVYVFM